MIKRIDLQFFSIVIILFALFQLITSFIFNNDYIDIFGTIHYILLGSFIFFFFLSRKIPVKQIYLLILIYQLLLVLGLFTFYSEYYHNPLGFEPTDEIFYNRIGIDLQGKNLFSSIEYLSQYVGISDYGFPLVIKYVYSLGGDRILVMKIFNVLFHILTCSILYKTSELLISKKNISKILLILYGLNPITVYFNVSGRKEPLFILVVVATFYFFYKALIEKKAKFYFFALFFTLCTGLFRTIFPVFILLSFGVFVLINLSGKYRNIKRAFYIFLGILLLAITIVFIENDLTKDMSVDKSALIEYRLGRAPTYLDYTIMTISGLIGPFPSFNYSEGNDSALLQTVGNFLKLFLSFFFLTGVYQIFKLKKKEFYPIIIFIALNIVMLVSVAASLDHRFLFPFIPVYFIVVALGFDTNIYPARLRNVTFYLIFITTLILGYNLR